ncbi:MAG: glycosyltransferase family 2 protein [Armatimonadota bacterium]
MARVCAIVLNWNGWVDTIQCLESILPQVLDGMVSVVVVDNASADDSAARIDEWISTASSSHNLNYAKATDESCPGEPHLALVRSADNLGYAAGNNLGIEFALEHCTCEFLWILNNDTAVHQAAVTELLKWADTSPETGILGSTLVDYYHRDKVQCAGGAYYSPWSTIYRPALAGADLDQVLRSKERLEPDYISGAAMLLRTEMVKRVGMLNADYFLYFEELDYSRRARCLGYRTGWCPASIVYHKGGASAGSRSGINEKKSTLSEYHSNLSALKYTRTFHPSLFPIAFVSRFCLKVLHCLAKRNFYLLRPLISSYKDFLLRTGVSR